MRWGAVLFTVALAASLLSRPVGGRTDHRVTVAKPAAGSAAPGADHPLVVVDPGHGGTNTGAPSVVEGVYEKSFTLALARDLVRFLEERGIAVVLTRDPRAKLICEEIFGPVLTVYVYEDGNIDEALELCDTGSPYGLTGAIFARDRRVIERLSTALRHTAGNFYINDKPTGAVVGQQPFGGGRASGTNDKAGSKLNLIRWTSARSIKENFVPPTGIGYPHMAEE